jgi:hypothetical protein
MTPRKMIAVSVENYDKIKKYGLAGDSLNLAISRILKMADRSARAVSV